MKTKLPSSSNVSPKSIVKCHGILSFLFILFMTVSSFGQVSSISFEFCDGLITFDSEGGIDDDGYQYWNQASVIFPYDPDPMASNPDPVVQGYTLKVGPDGVEGDPLFWNFETPTEVRYFKLPVSESICDGNWEEDTPVCQGVNLIVTCIITNDPDNDGDGFSASVDCNDNDDTVNATTTYYVDTDGDGFGTTAEDLCSATAPAGYATVGGDCDDNNASVNPGATEVCDGIDNNCDGNKDEGLEDEGCYEWCGDVEKQNKVVMCHNGKDICVSINAIDAHLAHGDSLNSCSSKSSNNGKGEKVEEIPTSYDVAFWPNPSNSNFNVKLITPNVTEKVSIEAYDINGRLIHSNIINGNENYQFGNNLGSGIYIVKLTQESTTKMIKVVKQ